MTGRIAYCVRRLALFPTVLVAVFVGAFIAVAAQWILRRVIGTNPTAVAAPIDITRVSLTIVGGIGGVVVLVVAYRRQRDVEQSRFVDRFGAAASQLGDRDVAIRIAGVYAMAGAADESDGLRRQQCIDVLCGYLRLPYDPRHGSSGRTKLVTTVPRVVQGCDRGEVEEHVEYRQNDREVRDTIVRVITDRLRPEAEYSWSKSNFDFRTAYLEEADFSRVTFSSLARFGRVTFANDAWFTDAHFPGNAWFTRAKFLADARFERAVFRRDAWFAHADFDGVAWFKDARFCGLSRFTMSASVAAASTVAQTSV
ncbi:pentapeptide repeat-containing protein [Nocardia crassostreae]|uniref:pentapeptide repeat-containing protein n=1 Tax=Nocardia crassostreae TaxID=53428 RepID=UPI0012FC5A75|nr:pentapeptide repeat-containing protein [Nocardia crassostreae]